MRDTSDFHTWYKDGYFWVDPTQKWANDYYGYVTNNKFDTAHNTCDRIVIEDDRSDWAEKAVFACFKLLYRKPRRRWPVRLDHPKDSMSWLHWRGRQLLRWLYLIDSPPYGWVHRMSRDPFIALISAATMFPEIHLIIDVISIPWYLYRPNTWRWHRKLKKDNRKEYVKELDYLRAKAIVNNHEYTYTPKPFPERRPKEKKK